MRESTFLISAWVFILLLTAVSCKKDPSKVGLDLHEKEYMDLGVDTLVLFASYSVEQDSAKTANLSTLVLGSLNDPVFGTTQAAFNTQLRLESLSHSFGEDVRIDSICLQLAYTGRWGDSTTMLTAHVYQLTEGLKAVNDSSYYSFDQIQFDSTPLGSKTFLDHPYDSVTVQTPNGETATYAPFLSIRLDNALGEKFISDSSSIFKSNEDFLNAFPGIRVAVEPVSGSFGKVLYFSPSSALSKMVLYYTNSDTSRSFSFPINTECVRFNNYETDHSLAISELQQQLSNPVPEMGNERLFLQPLAGTRIRVHFDGLENLRQIPNIALNDVRLRLYVDGYDKNLPPPSQLYLATVDEENTANAIIDARMQIQNYFGGKFDSEELHYTMRMTRYFQQRLSDPEMDKDNLYLITDGSNLLANRVVLYGNSPTDVPEKRAKIYIIYSLY